MITVNPKGEAVLSSDACYYCGLSDKEQIPCCSNCGYGLPKDLLITVPRVFLDELRATIEGQQWAYSLVPPYCLGCLCDLHEPHSEMCHLNNILEALHKVLA